MKRGLRNLHIIDSSAKMCIYSNHAPSILFKDVSGFNCYLVSANLELYGVFVPVALNKPDKQSQLSIYEK